MAAGIVDFATLNRGVLICFDLNGLPPGAHGIRSIFDLDGRRHPGGSQGQAQEAP